MDDAQLQQSFDAAARRRTENLRSPDSCRASIRPYIRAFVIPMRRKEDVMLWAGGAFGAALLGVGLLVAETPPMMDARAMREAFQRLDTDGDGVVTREEFEFNKVTVIFRRSSEPGAKLKYEDTRVSRATFDSFDLDGDGLITASDVREAPFFKFEPFDKNKDRGIDYAEFQEFLNSLAK